MFDLTETPTKGQVIKVFQPGDGITSVHFTEMMQPVGNRLRYLENSAIENGQRIHLPLGSAAPEEVAGTRYWTLRSTFNNGPAGHSAWVHESSNYFGKLDFVASGIKPGWQISEVQAYVHGSILDGSFQARPNNGMPQLTWSVHDPTTGLVSASGTVLDPSANDAAYGSFHSITASGLNVVLSGHQRLAVRIQHGLWTFFNGSAFGVLGVSVVVNPNP